MPLGPEFNPASTVGALNRPEVSTLLQFHCRLTNLVEMTDSFSFYFIKPGSVGCYWILCASHFPPYMHLQVIKKPGVIIKPIEFEEVNAYEKLEGHRKTEQKHQKNNKSKSNSNSNSRKNMTKMKTK